MNNSPSIDDECISKTLSVGILISSDELNVLFMNRKMSHVYEFVFLPLSNVKTLLNILNPKELYSQQYQY